MVTPEHHDALVDRLIQQTTPVRRMWSVRARFAVFATLGVIAIALASLAAPRPDLVLRLREPSFSLGLVLLIAATCVTGFLALRSSVPDRFPSRTESAIVAALIAAATVVTALSGTAGASAAPTPEWLCALRTIAVAALPWTLLLVAIRRGAPVRVTTAATYAGAAAFLLSAAILRTGCPADGVTHWLAWHFGAVVAGIAFSAAIAPAWLRTWRRH